MPRSTKSRGVLGRKAQTSTTDTAAIVDEVQDPQVEAALEAAAEPEGPYAADNAERPNDDEPTLAELDETEAEIVAERDAADLAEVTERPTQAPFAAQYDWDTATWTKPKGGKDHPCMCNRLAGHQCEQTTKSRFATGHDARFKGILQRAWRQGKTLTVDFGPEDAATVVDSAGVRVELLTIEMAPDDIARVLAPKLLPHVTHETRGAKLQKLDAKAGTTVPQTAVEHTPDEELTDADVEAMEDDAPEFVEA